MLPMRQILLAGALVATLVASLFDLPGLQAVPAPQTNGTPVLAATKVAAEPPAAPASAPRQERFASKDINLFAVRTWQPPPPPAPEAAVPKAPELPFRYLGKVLDDGQVMVFLGHSAQTHLVKKGDTLAAYKVDNITMAEMTFVYLPLNEKQKLIFGSAN